MDVAFWVNFDVDTGVYGEGTSARPFLLFVWLDSVAIDKEPLFVSQRKTAIPLTVSFLNSNNSDLRRQQLKPLQWCRTRQTAALSNCNGPAESAPVVSQTVMFQETIIQTNNVLKASFQQA